MLWVGSLYSTEKGSEKALSAARSISSERRKERILQERERERLMALGHGGHAPHKGWMGHLALMQLIKK